MSRGTNAIRTARREFQCSHRSYHLIRKGDLYLYSACPPEHEVNSSKKWWIIRSCLRCADHYGLHSSATLAQLAAKT